MFAIRVIISAICVKAALAEVIDETNIQVSLQTFAEKDELTWDLEFEGYKSQGVHTLHSVEGENIVFGSM